jgi:prepilin-type processing-associated H-X9-DG protein
MTPLSDRQKQLLFDYALGLTSEAETREAERLVAGDEEAARIHRVLQSAVSPLENWEIEPCPDHLVEATVARFQGAFEKETSQDRLSQLLATEEKGGRIIRIPLWRNFGSLAAVAAAIVLIAGIIVPAMGLSRQKYFQERCQSQLKGIYAGLASYVSDHDGRMPHVVMAAGAPWWKVGDQGQENQSNTRHAWLLVRKGYLDPDDFVCPGGEKGKPKVLDAQEISRYNDFPGREYVQFSMRMCCPEFGQMTLGQRRVILADLNPLSEKLPSNDSTSMSIRLNRELLRNSPNHNRRGQNVLFCDGSVEFNRGRTTKVAATDDIYMLNQMCDGCEITGTETPATADDAFLVP